MGLTRRLRRLHRVLIPAALIVPLSIAGCHAGSLSTQTVQSESDTGVSVALSAAPASLDFTRTSGAAIPQALMRNVYETLVTIAQDGSLSSGLATSWDVSDDGTRYVFHLREGVRFSDGTPFTAETVKFSIERVQSDAWTNGKKKIMDLVDDVTVIDDYTVAVTLQRSSNSWLWSMGTMVGAMMSPTGVDDDSLQQHPVGTGPFTVKRWAVGQALTLAARDDYWGTPAASSEVTLRYFTSATGAANALQSGDVDVVYSLQSPELIDQLRARNRYTIEVGTTNGEVLLTMNHRRAPFDDLRVRQAVMYAIDRQAVIDTAWLGYGVDTGGAPVPPTDPWFAVDTRYPFDPEKAKALLAEAGVTAPNNKIVLATPTRPYAMQSAEMIYSQLKAVGFDVRIEAQEFPAVWLSKVYKRHDYDMSIIVHIEPRDIANIFGNPDYYLGFDSPRVQQLLEVADTAPAEDYTAAMRQVVDAIMEQAAADTVFNYPNIVVQAPGVTGLNPNDFGEGIELARLQRDGASATEAQERG
ncbi:ABC transporter substrate-binding protein [Corynebacterium choanae]|nr:ABC transporter substrate-binding protein [Corynebacterium choanae]